jgi:hypothetical protein
VSPLPECDIVGVSQDYERPGGLVSVSTIIEVEVWCTCHQTHPSNKAMVLLKYVMVVANRGVSYGKLDMGR